MTDITMPMNGKDSPTLALIFLMVPLPIATAKKNRHLISKLHPGSSTFPRNTLGPHGERWRE